MVSFLAFLNNFVSALREIVMHDHHGGGGWRMPRSASDLTIEELNSFVEGFSEEVSFLKQHPRPGFCRTQEHSRQDFNQQQRGLQQSSLKNRLLSAVLRDLQST